ncbi:Lys-63-specific deubiquitinase [Nymphaea thermarum]|nr:Lys-63-specific deubiquitinase [Nymphaea thermarum]
MAYRYRYRYRTGISLHLTVSIADVRTQGMYQLLDSGFIGLIFSCFSEDAQKVGRIQVIAFQSLDGKQKSFSRSQNPNPTSGGPIINVESSWSSSESMSSASARDESAFQDTSDSRNVNRSAKGAGRNISPSDLEEFFAHADVNQAGRGKLKSEPLSPYTHNDTVQQTIDIDPMDMTAGMQEAMHRSNLDMSTVFNASGAEYTRKEVPLQVVPSSSLLKLDSPLTSFIDMQTMLFEEEKTAYNQAGWEDSSSCLHSPHLNLPCLVMQIDGVLHQLKENDVRLSLLKEEAEALEIEALNRAGSPILSPAGSLTSGVRMLPSVGQEQSASPERAANVRSPVGMTSSRSRRGY